MEVGESLCRLGVWLAKHTLFFEVAVCGLGDLRLGLRGGRSCRFVSVGWGRKGPGCWAAGLGCGWMGGRTREFCIRDSCTMGDISSSRSEDMAVVGAVGGWRCCVVRPRSVEYYVATISSVVDGMRLGCVGERSASKCVECRSSSSLSRGLLELGPSRQSLSSRLGDDAVQAAPQALQIGKPHLLWGWSSCGSGSFDTVLLRSIVTTRPSEIEHQHPCNCNYLRDCESVE